MISKALVVGAYHAKLRELSRLGVELTVMVPPSWGGQKLEPVRPEGYELLVMSCTFSGAPHFHFYGGISEVVAREAWDLVHIDEEPFCLVTHHVLRACRREGRKAIFFTWQNICKTYPPPFNYIEGSTYRQVEGAIAGNEEVREVLQAKKFSRPVEVIPQFGVDPEVFQKEEVSEFRGKLGIANKFAIGYVGRIVSQKGIADLIHALVSLPERCVLMLLGTGEDEGATRMLADKLGVASRVRWIRHVPSLEVPKYMNAFDVLVLPSRTTSRWKEQFGRVLIEAMACETAVVGSSSAEIPRVIGDAGLVFPEGDVTALVHHLRELHADSKVRAELGAKGRARILKSFTHRRIAQQTLKFYQRILNRSGAIFEDAICEVAVGSQTVQGN